MSKNEQFKFNLVCSKTGVTIDSMYLAADDPDEALNLLMANNPQLSYDDEYGFFVEKA